MAEFDTETGEIAADVAMSPAIATAIIAVKKRVRQLGSDERNEHGRYGYVSVDKFYATIGPMMAEAGLALLIDEVAADVRSSERTDDRGQTRSSSWLFARYEVRFLHESGALSLPLRRSLAMPISGPQAFGAAQSYVEKQFLRQVFKVPTGEKDADDTPQNQDAPAYGMTVAYISEEQRDEISILAESVGADIDGFCTYMKVREIADIRLADYGKALAALRAKGRKMQSAEMG